MVETATMVYELKVGMTCGGCSGAIERILGGKPGKFHTHTLLNSSPISVRRNFESNMRC